jgi:hypothetical protein
MGGDPPLSMISDPPAALGVFGHGPNFWALDRLAERQGHECESPHKPLNFHRNYSPSEIDAGLRR